MRVLALYEDGNRVYPFSDACSDDLTTYESFDVLKERIRKDRWVKNLKFLLVDFDSGRSEHWTKQDS